MSLQISFKAASVIQPRPIAVTREGDGFAVTFIQPRPGI